jgi:hypothetical protein
MTSHKGIVVRGDDCDDCDSVGVGTGRLVVAVVGLWGKTSRLKRRSTRLSPLQHALVPSWCGRHNAATRSSVALRCRPPTRVLLTSAGCGEAVPTPQMELLEGRTCAEDGLWLRPCSSRRQVETKRMTRLSQRLVSRLWAQCAAYQQRGEAPHVRDLYRACPERPFYGRRTRLVTSSGWSLTP